MELRTARERRKFYVERMLRRLRPGNGSNFAVLMGLPLRRMTDESLDDLLAVPYAVIGGIATRMYVPERFTLDIDVLVHLRDLDVARERLRSSGRAFIGTLAFPDSTLGLVGETWRLHDQPPLDLIASDGEWVDTAIAEARRDETGLRIVPRGTLVALKIDASRGIDQGDLTRLLGTADDAELAAVRRIVAQMLPNDGDDLETYIQLGRLEIGDQRVPPRDVRPES